MLQRVGKSVLATALAVLAIGAVSGAAPASAHEHGGWHGGEDRGWHGGDRGGWRGDDGWGIGLAGLAGLAVGAAIASDEPHYYYPPPPPPPAYYEGYYYPAPPVYGYPAYAYPGYGYDRGGWRGHPHYRYGYGWRR